MCRVEDLRAAVVSLDMAAAARLVSVARMRRYVAGRAGRLGVPQVRRALALADERSASPAESRLRLIWVLDAKRSSPLVNQPVWSFGGRLLGYADLLDPVAGVVAEYDGADHRGAWRQSRDEDRAGRLRDHGLEVVRFTGVDLAEPERAVARIQATYARAARKALTRRWTLQPPEDWHDDELPLDVLLDLFEEPAASS